MSIVIELTKKEESLLKRKARKLGHSLASYSRLALTSFEPIPEERMTDYQNPSAVKRALTQARREYKMGKIHTSL